MNLFCLIFGHKWIKLKLAKDNPLNPWICRHCYIDKPNET